MVNKYILYEDAAIDLERIINYITMKLKNPEGSSKLLDLFEKKFEAIIDYPYAYPVIYDSKLEVDGLRKCSVDNYLIVYHINKKLEQLEVVRIVYQREDYL